jgi:hypothetical protein
MVDISLGQQRKLESAWALQHLSGSLVPFVSSSEDLVAHVVLKDGYWTLLAWDWKTGQERYALALSQSQRCNCYWHSVTPNPFGHVDYDAPFGAVTFLIGGQ